MDSPIQTSNCIGKVHWNILPLLCAIAIFCYIDRTNLAFSSIELTKDLNFSPEVYGYGSGLFFLGYALFMVPSNLVLVRLGAPVWLGLIVVCWGIIAMSFSALQNARQFYTMRFLLGVAEAGAFPGIWYHLYLFYPTSQITFPMSVLEAAVSTANVIAAPLAAALLLLDGNMGLHGWQWVFIVEGIPSVIIGLLTYFRLPKDLQRATFLSHHEKRWLTFQLEQSRVVKEAEAIGNTALLWEALRNQRVWFVSAIGFCKNVAFNGILFWCPLLVNAIVHGVNLEEATAHTANHLEQSHARTSWVVVLTAIPYIGAAIFALVIGHSSQQRQERAVHLAVPYFMSGLLFAAFPRVSSHSPFMAFFTLCIVIAGIQGSNSVINSFIPAVAAGPSVSVAMALYNSVGNLGGFIGPSLVGWVVAKTGSYNEAIKVLGAVMCIASVMAWSTAKWEAPTHEHDLSHTKLLDDLVDF